MMNRIGRANMSNAVRTNSDRNRMTDLERGGENA